MSISSAIGNGATRILDAIVRGIVRTRVITPNILTLTGLLINIYCAWLYGVGHFFPFHGPRPRQHFHGHCGPRGTDQT